MQKYNKHELIQIITCYDQYIQSFYEDECMDVNRYPVCVQEFIDNEYQLMLDDGYNNYTEWLYK